MGRVIDILSTVVCAAAGVYLLSIQAQDPNSLIEAIAHGIGIYFLAKALFIARSTHLDAEAATLLGRLTEFAALRHSRETGEEV